MHKKKRCLPRVIGGVLALFLISVIVLGGIVLLSHPSYLMPNTNEWQTGDIFFSVGDSWESVAVRTLTGAKKFELTDSTPSHCGIVVRDNGVIKLVHESTVARKIVAETIDEYLKNNGSYCLYTVKVNPKPDSTAIRQTIDTMIANEIPFDFDFNHNDSKSLYCTEMVISVFEFNGYSWFSILRDQSYIYPEDLLKLCKSHK